jgi:hypothetical protein
MNKYATLGLFQLVGNGVHTNDWCGKFSSYWGCIRYEPHAGVKISEGVDYTGRLYVEVHGHSCHRPEYPMCYLSWTRREALKIDRLAEAETRIGKAEHVIAIIPIGQRALADYPLRQ